MTFAEAPNWRDIEALNKVVTRQCSPAYVDALGGSTKVIRRAAHSLFWFMPTKAQRDAGAAWLRCDLVLLGGDRLMNLPDHVALGGLPLDDSVAKCRKGRAADFAVTVCTRGHQYRATHSIRFPHSSYPVRASPSGSPFGSAARGSRAPGSTTSSPQADPHGGGATGTRSA